MTRAVMCWVLTALVTSPGLSIQVRANVGRCRGIGARTPECPSVCFTHWRNMSNPPHRTRGQKNEVCYCRGEARCVSNRPRWGRRTLHCQADIRYLLQSLLPKIWQTCRASTGRSHTHRWASKLLSSHFNPHLCFVPRVSSHPVSSRVFLICPRGLEEPRCTGREPEVWHGRWKEQWESRWISQSNGASSGLRVESDRGN